MSENQTAVTATKWPAYTGTSKTITRDMLTGWSACDEGLAWFDSHYPSGKGVYQEILFSLTDDDKADYAHWLMDKAGAEDTRLEVEIIADAKNFFFSGFVSIKKSAVLEFSLRAGEGIEAGEGIKAGWGIKAGKGIEASWGIKAGEGIEAGWGIKAGEGIEAGEGIKAGWGIKAGKGIEAGEGWACFAGLRVRVAQWSLYAKVIAKSKPENLYGGCFVETESGNPVEVKS